MHGRLRSTTAGTPITPHCSHTPPSSPSLISPPTPHPVTPYPCSPSPLTNPRRPPPPAAPPPLHTHTPHSPSMSMSTSEASRRRPATMLQAGAMMRQYRSCCCRWYRTDRSSVVNFHSCSVSICSSRLAASTHGRTTVERGCSGATWETGRGHEQSHSPHVIQTHALTSTPPSRAPCQAAARRRGAPRGRRHKTPLGSRG